MLLNAKKLERCTLRATDGEIGRVHDFYFDDQEWVVRYLVADTRRWLPGRQVLIAPASLEQPELERRNVPVRLTMDQIRHGPGIETERPVSRQMEGELSAYYGWPVYWGSAIAPGGMSEPMAGIGAPGMIGPQGGASPSATAVAEEEKGDPHLRSMRELVGYHIQASDGELGHVDDFLLDPRNWAVRYLVIDTRNWLPGRKALLAPKWINRFVWEDAKVYVDLPQKLIRTGPAYDPEAPMTSDYENALLLHYRERYGDED
jgi:uncharacterized protein YrrD